MLKLIKLFYRLSDLIIFKVKGIDVAMVDKERDNIKKLIEKQKVMIDKMTTITKKV